MKEDIKLGKKIEEKKEKLAQLDKKIENRYKKTSQPFRMVGDFLVRFDHNVLRKVILVPEVKWKTVVWEGCLCYYDKNKGITDYSFTDLVHRQVWKQYYGKSPNYPKQIHHIDNNKHNNEVGNLILLDRDIHMKVHRVGVRKENWI